METSHTENTMSTKVVDKLKLRRIPHATPYKISWLNKGQQKMVDEKNVVEFEIGEYKDKVLYEIMPMDACHLLLRYP